MKKGLKITIVISLIILFVILGIVLANFSKASEKSLHVCTEKACPSCDDVEGKVVCNDCISSHFTFYTWLINIQKNCDAQETITCENGVVSGKDISSTPTPETCESSLSLFTKSLN